MFNGIILTSTALIMRGIGMVFNIYVANKIGSEAVGIFSLIMSVYSFAITISTSGLGIACTYTVSEDFAKKNYFSAFKSVKTCMIFAITLSIGVSILIFILSPIISNLFLKNMVSPKPLYVITLGLPLISISSVIGGYLSAVGKSFKSAISQGLELTIKMIFTYILLRNTKNVEDACIALMLADVISEIFSFSLNVIFYNIDKRKYFEKRTIPVLMKRRIFKIVFPIGITSCIRSGLSSLKQFLIPIRLELSGLSYSMAVSKYGLINGMVMPILMFASVFINSFSGLLIPEFSRLLAGGNHKRLITICNTIFNLTFLFSIGICGIFISFSNDISLAVYQNLEPAFWISFFAPLIVFMYIDSIIDGMLKGINQNISVMFCNILDLIVTIAIIYFIVPKIGLAGYVFSIFVSEILNFTISAIQLKKKINFKIDFFNFVIRPILACIIAFFVIRFLNFDFNNLILSLIVKIICFSLIYLFLCNIKKVYKILFRTNRKALSFCKL